MVYTLTPPESIVESWPTPNYVDPVTRGPALYAVSIILIILGTIIVSIRTYTRLRITRAFGLDDSLIIVALLLGIALSVLVILGNRVYYSGRHVWDVPLSTFVPHRHNIWWSELLYVLSSCCTKISVLLFYRRLSISFTKHFMWATYIGLGINVAYLVVFVAVLCNICNPLDAYWNSFDTLWRTTHKYSCHPENITLPLSAAVSVLTDLYATLVPLFLIASIQKTRRDKIALYSIFSAGFIVVIFGITRTIYAYRTLNVDYDFTWVLWDCWIYTQLELYTAILAASAPALRPLIAGCITTSRQQSRRLSRSVVRPPVLITSDSKRFSAGTHETYTTTPEHKNPFLTAAELEEQAVSATSERSNQSLYWEASNGANVELQTSPSHKTADRKQPWRIGEAH